MHKFDKNSIKDSISLNIIAIMLYPSFIIFFLNYSLWLFYTGILFFLTLLLTVCFIIEGCFNFPFLQLSEKIKNNLLYSIIFFFGLLCAYTCTTIIFYLIVEKVAGKLF